MRSFVLIISEIQAVMHLRKETEKYFSLDSKCFIKIMLKLDDQQVNLEHELQNLLDIELGDWETLYKYVKI
jgi:hypothetical protein